jgi:hypothetical protein
MQVRHYVDKEIVMQLNLLPPKDISVGLLDGLTSLVSNKVLGATDLVSNLFKDFFPKWLSEIKEQIIYKTVVASDTTTEQINSIILLMRAAITDNQENIDTVVQMQLHDDLARIFLQTNQNNSRYLPLAYCLTEIAKMSEKAASEFLMMNIHLELFQDTKLTFYQYKKV